MRSFGKAFQTDEIAVLEPKLGAAKHLPEDQKIQIILDATCDELATAQEAADFSQRKRLMLVQATCFDLLGDHEREEEVLRSLVQQGDRMQYHALSYLVQQQGRYDEAKELELEALRLFAQRPDLGRDSPQTLSARRHLIELAVLSGQDGMALGKGARSARVGRGIGRGSQSICGT